MAELWIVGGERVGAVEGKTFEVLEPSMRTIADVRRGADI